MTKSTDPVDQLIRDLLVRERTANEEEIAAIIARLASAPFNDQLVSVPRMYRGLHHPGPPLGNRERSLRLHLTVRVVKDRQWSEETDESTFLDDLHEAVRHHAARLILYHRRGGALAAVLSPNNISREHLGPGALPLVYVIYSADRSTIVSGYQASDITTISIPGEAQWLR